MKRLTNHARQLLGHTIEIKWGTSRGRDSYGYTTCSLWWNRCRVAACNGGGYDMRGTVVGHWIASVFKDELLKLKPKDMPAQSHWEPDRKYRCSGKCHDEHLNRLFDAIENGSTHPREPEWSEWGPCPKCGAHGESTHGGRTVDDGRYLYGLRFYDPTFDPGKTKVTYADGTFVKEEDIGKTISQLEDENKSFGLERIRSFYSATSPHPTRRHRVPTIDGACGFESVRSILNAIGLDLKQVANTSKLDVYEIVQHKPN